MRTSPWLTGWTAVLALWLPCETTVAVEPAHLVDGFERGLAVLETRGPRCLLIDIYFAITAEQRRQGLMYVESLGEFEGMYFPSPVPVEITMWMKNTLVPLDMLFIRQGGEVGHIARDARPLSTDRISSGGPVVGVLELNAGFARRWGVERGTRLRLL
jgi:uncharacterized membrane protein (UPF0127 family)